MCRTLARYRGRLGGVRLCGKTDVHRRNRFAHRAVRLDSRLLMIRVPAGQEYLPMNCRRDFCVSNERLEAAGWTARHTVDDGIRELVVGYRTMHKGPFFNV